jgi:phage replication-related protein YjqB (UPF0714/DUF867 family)
LEKDTYNSFQELKIHEKEGVDFSIKVLKKKRSLAAAILAPHGGSIEPRTSRIATGIAGTKSRLYCFEGLKRGQKNRLHITSHHFDEPKCLKLIENCTTVVAVHGCDDIHGPICIGGLDKGLKDRLAARLVAAGFEVRVKGHKFLGTDPENICNRGATGEGVQFELSKKFRNSHKVEQFIKVVRVEINRAG